MLGGSAIRADNNLLNFMEINSFMVRNVYQKFRPLPETFLIPRLTMGPYWITRLMNHL